MMVAAGANRSPGEMVALIVEALANVLGLDPGTIDDSTPLDDLDVDSLALTSLILEVEDLLGCDLPLGVLVVAADRSQLDVVGDMARLLARAGANRSPDKRPS